MLHNVTLTTHFPLQISSAVMRLLEERDFAGRSEAIGASLRDHSGPLAAAVAIATFAQMQV